MAKERDPGYPYGEFDAVEWVKEFENRYPHTGISSPDLLGWFANAIMTGYDKAKNEDAGKDVLWHSHFGNL